MSETVQENETKTVDSGDTFVVGPVLTVEGTLVSSGVTQVDNVHRLEAKPGETTKTIEQNTTETVASGSTKHVDGVLQVEGTLESSGITEVTPAGTDVDSATATLDRKRNLTADATDVDSADATLQRIRNLVGDAVDVDTAETVFLPITNATDPRVAVADILSNTGDWPGDKPDVDFYDDVTPKARQNKRQPALYVHKPIQDEIERFSPRAATRTEDETVEVLIFILESDGNPREQARKYRNRIVNQIRRYSTDNYLRTEFHRIEPTASTDNRAQHITRQSDHYVYSVEIQTHRLKGEL
jgi:predicted RecA/RadA family phage recombinase